MRLKEEYSRVSDKAEDQLGKKVISDDAFAICEYIEQLIDKLSQLSQRIK